MPDDDRTRRRLGDETKGRIANLASGWTVDDPVEDAAPEPVATPARRKQPTLPPPPPGSDARKALEAASSDPPIAPIATPRTKPPTAPPPARATRPTAPPPVPAAARKSPTQPVPTLAGPSKSGATAKPPSLVKSGPTETGTVDVSGVIGGMTPAPALFPGDRVGARSGAIPAIGKVGATSGAVRLTTPPSIKDALPLRADTTDQTGASPAMPPPRPPPRPAKPPPPKPAAEDEDAGEATEVDPGAHLAVPVGEFDHGSTRLEQDKLRLAHEQATLKRDPASVLLGIAEPPLTTVKETPVELLLGESAAQLVRGDATAGDPKTERFERGDPTLGSDATTDATTIEPPRAHTGAPGGKLRAQAALRRKRGIGGDVRYVATALFGVRRARHELGELELQQAARQKERARHLLTLGRAAVVTEGFDHPALNKVREQLGDVEDERARHAAQVTAADSELLRVRNDRDFKVKQYAHDLEKLEAELTDVTKKLEPLEKAAAAAARRAAQLHEALRRIDTQIAATEASKVAVKSSKLDPAAIQAELATLAADRQSVTREEPVIAAELDALNPRIAALDAARSEARKKQLELETAEQEDQRRASELLAAIGAKRKVVDRAASDAEALRDKILLELGERIYVDRPANMTAQLSPVDTIDVELGTTDRRMMELKEIMSSVDRAKLARGIAVIVLVLAAAGSLATWLLYVFA